MTGDHLWQHPIMGGPEGGCLEAYTTLAFLAAHSSSVRLFTLATGAHFRHPALLAKTVTTLDVLSGGRASLGIGTGHNKAECDGLGVPFPSNATRYELLEDALEMCIRMWAGEHGTDGALDGYHVHAERLLNLPQAVQRPRPRLPAPDFERIERTCAFAFAPSDGGPASTERIEQLRWLADLGIDTVIGRIDGVEQRTPIELLARHVLPAAAEMEGRR